jgi:hypothetical protein
MPLIFINKQQVVQNIITNPLKAGKTNQAMNDK